MYETLLIAILFSMVLVIIRLVIGTTFFDRLLAVLNINTHVVIIIAILAKILAMDFLIDIAIIYALVSFISLIGFLMYFKYQREE